MRSDYSNYINRKEKKMKQRTRKTAFVSVVGIMVAGIVLSVPAWGASFPQKGKAIQLLVHFTAGGSSDVGARILASGLEKDLGTSVVIVNKPGANSQIGMTALAQARPDGYTFGTTNFPVAVTTYLDLERKAVYTRNSFQPLALHVADPNLFAVKANSPYKTLKELVEAAKAKPKTITISSGVLNDDQIAILLLQKLSGAQFAQVSFTAGGAPAVTALLGGKIDVYCGNVGDMLAQYKSGEVRILGIMDDVETPFYPGVKTFAAQGYKVISSSSRGFAAPAKTPKEIVDMLSGAIKKVVATEEHKKRMADMGLTLKYMDAAQYAKFWEEYEVTVKDLMALAKD